jgi:endonuclease III
LSTKKINRIIAILAEYYPDAKCSLFYYDDPWKLLVMARLSAQCTDARVNLVSKELFERFPTAESLADGDLSEIEKLVFTCGLYKTKAKSIKEASKIIAEQYHGIIPDNMEELLSLPGVGRKIANLILGDIYGKSGIVADTHCIRIANRLGFVKSTNPLIVERTLDAVVPKKEQSDFCHRLVLFGREICCAKNPHCDLCPLQAQTLCTFKYIK